MTMKKGLKTNMSKTYTYLEALTISLKKKLINSTDFDFHNKIERGFKNFSIVLWVRRSTTIILSR